MITFIEIMQSSWGPISDPVISFAYRPLPTFPLLTAAFGLQPVRKVVSLPLSGIAETKNKNQIQKYPPFSRGIQEY